MKIQRVIYKCDICNREVSKSDICQFRGSWFNGSEIKKFDICDRCIKQISRDVRNNIRTEKD